MKQHSSPRRTDGPPAGRALVRWALSVLGSTVLYLVLVARLDVASVVQGLVVSAGAVALVRAGGRRGERSGHRLLPLLPWVPVLAVREVLKGSWKVATAAAGLRPQPRGAVVEVPLGDRPAVNPAALAILETLSPGTYLIDTDRERGVMIYHLFDAADAPEMRRRQARLLGAEEDGP